MGVASGSSDLVNVPGASAQEANAGTYYIYASSAGQTPGEDIKVLSAGTATDTFVASLNSDKAIVLSSAPSPTANLDASDKTKQWLQRFDSTADGSLTLDANLENIDSFMIKLSKQWPLTFSSDTVVLGFTFGSWDNLVMGPRIPIPGIDSTGLMLTFGLDFEKTPNIDSATVKDLFTYAALDGMLDTLPQGLLGVGVTLKRPQATDPPRRNAVWLVPTYDMQSTIRLQFQFADLAFVQGFFGTPLKGFTLKSVDAICKKKVIVAQTENGEVAFDQGSVALTMECSVQAPGADAVTMSAGVEFFSSGITLTFTFASQDLLGGILKWLAYLIGDDTLEGFVNSVLGKEENGTKLLANVMLRRLIVSLDTTNPDSPSLSSFSFDIEVSANFGGGTTSSPAVFLISYIWDSFTGGFGTLSGQLWNEFNKSGNLDLLPYEEKWTTLQPVTATPATSVKIVDLIPGVKVGDIPDTLPSEITRAYVQFSSTSFAIGGTVAANPISKGSAPQPYLGDVSLDASFDWGQGSNFTLHVSIDAGIVPSSSSSNPTPAFLTGSLDYSSSTKKWQLQATLTGLYASTLVEFFDEDDKTHVGSLIDSIAIDQLSVAYTYAPTGNGTSKGSEFVIQGDLLIAALRLSLNFTYQNGGFQFTAALNPKDKNATIGDVLIGILGSGDEIELPDFITNMVLVGNNKDVFGLNIKKKDTSFQFLSEMNIGSLHMAFAQLHSSDWPATAPSKRLIQIAIQGFADIKIDVPLIGELQQPLDELYFMWVQDTSPKPGVIGGFLRKDLAQINTGLKDPILVKDKIKPEQAKDTDMLVAAGCHFAVIIRSPSGDRSCLLDYEFMKPKSSGSSQSDRALTSRTVTKGLVQEGTDDDGGPTAQAPYKKTAGPLAIDNVGLKYKSKKLAIMFDATFQLGPIGFSLIGFSLEFQFETLDKFPDISANIQGLAAAFEKPPLTIAGIIRHGNEGGIDYYAGGLVVGWTVYQFQAAGFYGVVTIPGRDSFRSVFVFAKLNGPLVTLEFAEISGICGGFGYNSSVRVPTINEIYEFPFIASTDLGSAANALEALQKLTSPGPSGWFQPLDKTYWAAVGMKVDAFKMLSFDAVLVVQFGEAIKLGLFAMVIADVPTAASPIKLAHVELGISAVADFQYGTLKIEAQLSPRSFIFDPSCHLTGGMGLYYWFDAPQADQSKIGDFVFTLGGYHQAFDVPVGYPNPPRLGISWSLGSTLSISGQAYFAITPKACMAGGRLHASFAAGPIGAWFDAFADFLINYKPFHFNASAGIAIGVYVELKILFIHIKISVEISAQLYLWGPPVAGRVHVDLWIVSFDINFGASESGVPAISLSEFYELVLQASESQAAASRAMLAMASGTEAAKEEQAVVPMADVQPPKNEGHNFLPVAGLLNPNDQPNKPPNTPWVVRAGTFSFVVACKMAIKEFTNEAAKDPKVLTGGDVYSKPMKLTSPMTSKLVVKVQQEGVPNPDDGWQYEKHMKSVPRALWAMYDPAHDPSGGRNNIKDLLNGDQNSMDLMMGVQMTAPPAQMAPDPFPPFNVADADLQRLLSKRPFPTIANVDPTWAPGVPFTGDEVAKQYEAVQSAWVTPGWGTGDDGQAGFVGVLAQSMKWAGADVLKSIAGMPSRLKKGFMTSYVAAPMLTN